MSDTTNMPVQQTDPTNDSTAYATAFDASKQHDEYGDWWSARDLLPLLGYNKWQRAEDVLARAKAACEEIGITSADHFTASGKLVGIGSRTKRRIQDYRLTRLAAYLVAQNADPRGRQQVAAAQVFFAVSTQELQALQERATLNRRAEMRERVEQMNAALEDSAQQVGVPIDGLPDFHEAGYRGMYDGRERSVIKSEKDIAQEDDLLDRMSLTELAANAFRMTQTESRLAKGDIAGAEHAQTTHFRIGQGVREAMADMSGILPEDLPAEPTIRPIIEERKPKTLPPAPKENPS